MANDVRVVVRADTGGARQEITSFAESIQGGLLNASNVAKAALLGLGAAGVGAFGGAVKVAADFEHSLSQVGAVANATEAEMAALRAEALKIGADTAFSASQAAGAMEVLAANGVSARDIIGGAARAAADLAAAGGTDLVTAANIASTAMAVWGMRTEDLTNVVNRLAGAANSSRFGVEDMGLAIAQGGGVAAAAGVSFDDFAAAIAATASSFSSGADAGTSFKTFITALTGNSEKAKETMRELGLEFYDAQGKLKPMTAIVQELHDKLGPLSEAQQTVALKTIFGNDAYRTAAGLMKLTGDEFEELSRKMGATNAADVAAQRMGNLKGNVEQLKGSLETMAIGIGSMVLPALTEAAGGATQVVNVLSGLPSSTQATALAFGAISIAAPAAVKGVNALVTAFNALRTGTATLGTSLSGISLAIGGIAVAADLILQKTSGHGLFEWLFGDVAGAERQAKAAAELEARFRAAGSGADTYAIALAHLREKVEAWSAAEAELRRVQEEGLPLWQQNAAVQQAAGAMSQAEAAVRAVGQAMKDQNVDALEMARVYNELPPKLRAVFDGVTGIAQVMGTQEFAMRSAATVTDGWRASMEESIRAMRDAEGAGSRTRNEFNLLGRSVEELGGSFDKVVKALKDWGQAFADNDPAYKANAFMLAALSEELADLKAKGDALTAAERERLQVVEAMIQRLGEQQSAMEDNKKAIEGMVPLVAEAIGPKGLDGLMTAMGNAKRAHEDQIDVLRRLGEAYIALKNGNLQEFRRGMEELKAILTPEEWYQIAMASGSAVAEGLAGGIYAQMTSVLGAGEALFDAALQDEQRASARAYPVGEAITQGVAQGMQSPSALSWLDQAGNMLIRRLQKVLEIYSPSRKAADLIGRPVGEGIGEGIIRELQVQMNRIAKGLLENLQAGVELARPEVEKVLAALGAAAVRITDDTVRMGIQQILHQMLVDLERGVGVANIQLAELAQKIQSALNDAARAAAAEPAPDAQTEQPKPAGLKGWLPSEGGYGGVGAHGVQLVWDDRAQAWVYPWEVGSVGSPGERAAYMERWQRGETLIGAIPPSRQQVVVQINIDGRAVAEAIAEPLADYEFGRNAVQWGAV